MKVGSKTAGILLLATAIAMILELMGWNAVAYLIDSWPLLFIVLGIEYLWMQNRGEKAEGETKLHLAWGRLISSLIIAVVAIVGLQSYTALAHSTWGFNGWFGSKTEAQEQEPQTVAMSANIDELEIDNENGSLVIEGEDREDVKVLVDIQPPWLWEGSERELAESVKVSLYEDDNELHIETDIEGTGFWFFKLKPAVHLTVKIPEDHELDYDITQKNGSITAADLPLKQEMEATTTNGKIEVKNMSGDFALHSTNGTIAVQRLSGNVNAKTTNGKLELEGGFAQLQAKTTNGTIVINSETVAGDWDVHTTNGKVQLTLPKNGDYMFKGKTSNGSIHAEEPLDISGKDVSGQVGNGEHTIEATTTNGSIQVLMK